jgi:hypothetical protein
LKFNNESQISIGSGPLLQTLLELLYHEWSTMLSRCWRPADGHSTTVYEPRRELGIGTSGIGTMGGAEAHDRLSISFEKPVLVGSSSTTSFYFPAAIQRLSAKGDTRGPLIVPVSNSKDTVKSCTANCSTLMASSDGGASWHIAAVDPPPAATVAAAPADVRAGGPCTGAHCLGFRSACFIQDTEGVRTLASATRQGRLWLCPTALLWSPHQCG